MSGFGRNPPPGSANVWGGLKWWGELISLVFVVDPIEFVDVALKATLVSSWSSLGVSYAAWGIPGVFLLVWFCMDSVGVSLGMFLGNQPEVLGGFLLVFLFFL